MEERACYVHLDGIYCFKNCNSTSSLYQECETFSSLTLFSIKRLHLKLGNCTHTAQHRKAVGSLFSVARLMSHKESGQQGHVWVHC